MKFDKPGTQNPTDRKKVIGKRTIDTKATQDRPARRNTPTNGTTCAPKPAYGYILGAAIAEGPHRLHRPWVPRNPRRAFSRCVSAENAGPLGKGN
jgi:xanthine dehydrogenase YagR molybdenum-binding subunit